MLPSVSLFKRNTEFDFVTNQHNNIIFYYVSSKDFKLPLWYEPKLKERYEKKDRNYIRIFTFS
jgi:hypothetical protein